MPYISFSKVDFSATTYFIKTTYSEIASLSGEEEESFYKIITSTFINLYIERIFCCPTFFICQALKLFLVFIIFTDYTIFMIDKKRKYMDHISIF